MSRLFAPFALLVLLAMGGCASTSSNYYSNGSYADDGYYDSGYVDDGYAEDRYYDGGTYAGGSYGGDYYYGSSGYDSYGSNYLMWPEYYSLFWPINHWYADPYYYPGYYYGVTYFPQNYLSLSMSYGGRYGRGWGYSNYYSSYLAYSPYRYSWADNYYDWYPWYYGNSGYSHGHRSSHSQRPRYGSARNEAERVLRRRDEQRSSLAGNNYRGAANRGSTAVDARGPRGAYYPNGSNRNAAGLRNANGSDARAASRDVSRQRSARESLLRSNQRNDDARRSNAASTLDRSSGNRPYRSSAPSTRSSGTARESVVDAMPSRDSRSRVRSYGGNRPESSVSKPAAREVTGSKPLPRYRESVAPASRTSYRSATIAPRQESRPVAVDRSGSRSSYDVQDRTDTADRGYQQRSYDSRSYESRSYESRSNEVRSYRRGAIAPPAAQRQPESTYRAPPVSAERGYRPSSDSRSVPSPRQPRIQSAPAPSYTPAPPSSSRSESSSSRSSDSPRTSKPRASRYNKRDGDDR